MSRKRQSHRRRSRRGLSFAVAAVAAGLIAGTFAIATGTDHGKDLHTSADAPVVQQVTEQLAEPTAASAPQHKEKPVPVATVPKNEPAKGLVYTGLVPAAAGDRCAGVYQAGDADHQCTHGPDAPPPGKDVQKDTPPAVTGGERPAPDLAPTGGELPSAAELLAGAPPVLDLESGRALTPAAEAGAVAGGTPAAAAAAEGGKVVCDGDGSTGNRVQVLYVHGPGKDRFGQYLASFKKWAADTDVIYNASAQETGGTRHVRYVTEPDCSASVLNVELSDAAMAEFGASNKALAAQGFNRKDRKYMIFADANVYCGIGTFNGDERPGQDNLSNFGPSYGRTDNGCWGGSTAAHELGHNLGAVNNSAPHTSKGAHCVDEWDIMCYSDSPYYPKMQTVCPNRASDDRLDCNHDDYYNTAPQPGSYLATHWNVADNRFLLTNGGSTPDPTPSPTPTRTPSPSPTTASPSPSKSASPSPSTSSGPSPSPSSTTSTGPSPSTSATGSPSPSPTATTTPGPTPTGGTTAPRVTVGQTTPVSAVLSWPAVAGARGYDVRVGGRSLAVVNATVVRLIGLRPDTEYQVAVAVQDAAGKLGAPGRATAFRTPKSAGPSPTTPGTRYLLANDLTGQAADMWGGSTRDGAVLIGYQRTGYANQQWLFDDAGDGYLRIRSAKSDKCLQLGGPAVAGQYVAQQPCSGADAQKWRIGAAGRSFGLTAKGSDLLLGTSKRWYYGGWLLELQRPNGQAYQNWSIQAAS
ncbi:RICIN domain-containing protein [Kitasatospora sp. NPDC096147]|uniref:RICIN domain-containing protein n=1 Tax=Kitasatospora sp. NPDC096147 TaxID=3364093 RepID=UPI0037F28A64